MRSGAASASPTSFVRFRAADKLAMTPTCADDGDGYRSAHISRRDGEAAIPPIEPPVVGLALARLPRR